jgi:hypothetical protein
LTSAAVNAIPRLTAAELTAAIGLWGAQHREFVARFGGTSMCPTIAPDQPVLVRCGQRPTVGEVAVFQRGETVNVHRVVADDGRWLLTWGDANLVPDDPVDAARQLVGVVAAVERDGVMSPVPPPPRRALKRALLKVVAPAGSSGYPRAVLLRRVVALGRGGLGSLAQRAWRRLAIGRGGIPR